MCLSFLKPCHCDPDTSSKVIAIDSRNLTSYQLWKIMLSLLPSIAILLTILPVLISAQCAACDSYTNALESCQTSVNVTAVGTKTDSTTIHCMCTSRSNVTDMNACQGCVESSPSTLFNAGVLLAWTTTCQADASFGDKQAALCWESQPSNSIPCTSEDNGSGSGNGGTNSGGTVATSTASAGAASSANR